MSNLDIRGAFHFDLDQTELYLYIPDNALLEIGTIILDEIRKNASQGVGADGKVYKNKKGKKIDWRQSGDMLDNASVEVNMPGIQSDESIQEVAVLFLTDYASFINQRYPFLGVGPTGSVGFEQVLAPKISKIIEKYAELKSTVL